MKLAGVHVSGSAYIKGKVGTGYWSSVQHRRLAQVLELLDIVEVRLYLITKYATQVDDVI